ncbi:MAG: DUF3830 family protein [Caldiserica bacterium]|nr:DUF3830 family protein [Caldisericota bacterium]
MRIVIEADSIGTVEAELLPERAPRTVEAIAAALPLEGIARRWGEEVYFEIPVEAGEENPVEVVEAGDIGYWPPGRALCIFFGPTPASRNPDEIRPASPVNPVGRVLGDPGAFAAVRDGERIRVKSVSSG